MLLYFISGRSTNDSSHTQSENKNKSNSRRTRRRIQQEAEWRQLRAFHACDFFSVAQTWTLSAAFLMTWGTHIPEGIPSIWR